MNNIICIVALVCAAFTVKGTQPAESRFTLKGEIAGYGDGRIIISYSNPNKKIKPDTVSVKNDRFVLKGSLEAPMMSFFKLMNNGKLKRDFFRIDFILEKGTVEIRADVNNLEGYTLTGAGNNTMFRKMLHEGQDKLQDFIKVEKAFHVAKDNSPEKENLRAEMEDKKALYLKCLLNYDGYFNTYAGTYSLWLFSQRRVPWQRLDTLLNRFNDSVKNSPYFVYMERRVNAAKRTEAGRKAADFMVKDLDGKLYSLEDFSGHYFLMTFSASWCAPCKLEYPFLRKAYEHYALKGLKMVIMNVDDSREKWAGDVKKYEFPFPVLSDLNAFSGPLTENYGVLSIPKIFLIDPTGRIVSGTIRQQAILDKLKEIYP